MAITFSLLGILFHVLMFNKTDYLKKVILKLAIHVKIKYFYVYVIKRQIVQYKCNFIWKLSLYITCL